MKVESSLIYKGMSKIYDLLDVIYFRNINRSPRTIAMDYINQNDNMILDVCTGTAANAIAIANRYKEARIIGIDLSNEMLHIADKKVKKQEINNINLYKMDATKTSFHDNTFDVILISLVLHEVHDELAAKILLEAKRIVKPEGKILIIEWEEPKSFLKKILFFLIRMLEPKGFEQFLKTDMKSYFERFDLVISDIKHCDYSKVINLKKE
jgi:demethylmenaquinone methyltransferase/2-methoxy-6-polyprenyl-1,4-benzoquinol methylase